MALLTDFGHQDHYVGAVKGAVLAACPGVTLVDVGHEVPPHDVLAGAFALAACYRAFPAGSVFLAVVDPEVGSARRPLALAAGGYFFVGPDNGIFSLVLADAATARVHEITNRKLLGPGRSRTFHARDIFGPVAGRLAAGTPLPRVGPAVRDPVVLPIPSVRRISAGEWSASVLHVDRFGNLTTTLTEAQLEEILAGAGGDPNGFVVAVEGVVMPLARAYADVAEGEPCALVGSSGRLEVAVHRGNASRLLGAGRGAPVTVRKAFSV
ncbi:MAG TPA: SAM-dependent chlorinase/fluorinase [Vicinamibacteria bacterium]|nr:SAM-dependent chlorinase/fluorinase [Vicinamibacteria bacterium]